MSSRTRNALIGLLVGLGCAVFIVYRLVQAAAPASTSVHFTNHSPLAVRLQSLAIGDEPVLSATVPLAAAVAGQPPAPVESKSVRLSAGRPLAVSATLASGPVRLGCTLEPRPQGVCVIKAAFEGTAALQCEYACKPAGPPP
ncbi:MAG: hypothetical protein QM750_02125 [Rubrivivax sp.]